MSPFTVTQEVGSVVAAAPRTARVFESHGIDYCCGGHVPLTQACANKGVEPVALLAELEAAAAGPSTGPDLRDAPLDAVIDYILSRHHDFVRREVPRLVTLMDKVVRVHGEKQPDVLPSLGRMWRTTSGALLDHMAKEETVLFPWIRAITSGRVPPAAAAGVEGPISVMEAEHEEHGERIAAMRRLAGDYRPPEDACGSWRALYAGLDEFEKDLHTHIHIENNVLFPRVRLLVD